jgi:hypothetical protein
VAYVPITSEDGHRVPQGQLFISLASLFLLIERYLQERFEVNSVGGDKYTLKLHDLWVGYDSNDVHALPLMIHITD